MRTKTAQSNLNLSVIAQKGRFFAELATESMKMAIPYPEHYHSVKVRHFAEVK